MSEEIMEVRVKVEAESTIIFLSVDDVLIFAAAFWQYSGFKIAWQQCHPDKRCDFKDFKRYKSAATLDRVKELVNGTFFEDGRLLADVLYQKAATKLIEGGKVKS